MRGDGASIGVMTWPNETSDSQVAVVRRGSLDLVGVLSSLEGGMLGDGSCECSTDTVGDGDDKSAEVERWALVTWDEVIDIGGFVSVSMFSRSKLQSLVSLS